MTCRFDAYVMVDWSAGAVPKTGPDSIWYCCAERRGDALIPDRLGNPPTRRQAMTELADLVSDLIARNLRTLLGFDFAFGYPAGFAAHLRPQAPTWLTVWKEIAGRVRDGADNANNRFEVAAEFNRRLSGRAFPFWGCPQAAVGDNLTATRPHEFGNGSLAEFRIAERRICGPQSTWKLAYAGSVGSQTLLGIAHLFQLRHHPWLAGALRIWPFETGLKPLAVHGDEDWRVLAAEVYPSMLSNDARPGEVKDAAQVRALAHHFAQLDVRGELAPLFAGPVSSSLQERRIIEREEGWILGVTGAPVHATAAGGGHYAYERDPDAIYRLSFARIAAEADLTGIPNDVRPLAVRLIHASGMPDLVADLTFSSDAAAAGRDALARGAPILVDSEMVAAGIIRARLPASNPVRCLLSDPAILETARRLGTTRSAAAVEQWLPQLGGAVVAIGNAPTALFRLLELLDDGAPKPAVILGFPVGFVGAAEAKEALIGHGGGVPFVTLRGRRGGSALAAAAVNALAGDAA